MSPREYVYLREHFHDKEKKIITIVASSVPSNIPQDKSTVSNYSIHIWLLLDFEN